MPNFDSSARLGPAQLSCLDDPGGLTRALTHHVLMIKKTRVVEQRVELAISRGLGF